MSDRGLRPNLPFEFRALSLVHRDGFVGRALRRTSSATRGDNAPRDVCAVLFEVCRSLQKEILDTRGITCFFDVDGGALPLWQCNAIGGILRKLFHKICSRAHDGAGGGRITVALHHTGQVWILGVTDKNIRAFKWEEQLAEDSLVKELAGCLNGTYRTQTTAQGATSAVLFIVRPRWGKDPDRRSLLPAASPYQAYRVARSEIDNTGRDRH